RGRPGARRAGPGDGPLAVRGPSEVGRVGGRVHAPRRSRPGAARGAARAPRRRRRRVRALRLALAHRAHRLRRPPVSRAAARAARLDARMADALAGLGCFRVWIGSESGSQKILDAMERGVRVEEVREAVRLCRERGIGAGMFLMWGYEGEELSDIEATVEHVKASLPDVFLTTVSYPIKGTRYYDEVA